MHWHDYLAFALVAAASGYIALRAYRAVFAPSKTGCAIACGSCRHSDSGTSQPRKLLAIDAPLNDSRPNSGT